MQNRICLCGTCQQGAVAKTPLGPCLGRHVGWLLLVMAGLGPMVGSCARSARAGTRLEARIVEDATGEPLAARVAVTNPDGKFLEIEGRHEHVQYLGKRWCYVDGSFALTIPEAGAKLEIRRGLETRPLSATITNDASGPSIQKTFRLPPLDRHAEQRLPQRRFPRPSARAQGSARPDAGGGPQRPDPPVRG